MSLKRNHDTLRRYWEAEEERKEEALEYHAIFADEIDECKELSHRRQAPSFRAALVITKGAYSKSVLNNHTGRQFIS